MNDAEIRRLNGIRAEIGQLNQQVGELEHEAATLLAGTDDGEEWSDCLDQVIDWSSNCPAMTTDELLQRCGIVRTTRSGRQTSDGER